jgi:tetratricopeptide (TPR) repeat protein
VAENQEIHYVARPSDILALKAHLDASREGQGRTVVLEAPLGGGKRALVGELIRTASTGTEDLIVWRVGLLDEEDGFRTLLRMYASLFATLHRAPLLRTKVEMILNAQMPQHPKRVQGWFQSFIEGLKQPPKPGEETFQVSLPRDNPVIGLVEIVAAIASKTQVIFDVQNVHNCHSLAIFALLEALMDVTRDRTRLCTILSAEPIDERSRAYIAGPWEDFLKRRGEDLHRLSLEPWGVEDVQTYLESRGLSGNVSRIHEIARGLPGFVAEVTDLLKDRGELDAPLEGATLASLTPMDLDPSALDDDGEEESSADSADSDFTKGETPKRKKAGVADALVIQHIGALLGQTFPSNLIADMAGFERDSVDDILDASDELVKEDQFNENIQSWLYSFKRAIYRYGVLMANDTPEGRERATRVGLFLERFLAPRGYEFIVKVLRIYGEAGQSGRAASLQAAALSSDRPEIWAMLQELFVHFKEIAWPDIMRRAVFTNLLERLVMLGNVEAAEKLFNEALQWATEKGDRPLQAWILFTGSRLDYRRQDLYRAKDRARDALTLFMALDDVFKAAEVHEHIALLELSDGAPNAAQDHVKAALDLSDKPPIQANASFIRGLVEQRERKFTEAVDHFRRANEIAGAAGIGPIALEAGIHLGECLLLSRQSAQAADVLGRCIQIAQALRNPVRERAATAMLAQAQADQKLFEAALRSAKLALELSRQLKFQQYIPLDTYNVGLFSLLSGNLTEAVSLFRQAAQGANPQDLMFTKELHYNLGMSLYRIGEKKEARGSLERVIDPALKSKDFTKALATWNTLADIAVEENNLDRARDLLRKALTVAEAENLREDRKNLKRKLDGLAR